MTSPILHTLSKPISGVCHDSCQHSRHWRYVGNFFLMLVFKSCRVLGRFTYTRDIKKKHRKKSQGVKSGERAGYSKSPLIEMRRSDEGCDHRTSARKVGLNCKRTLLTVPRHNSDWTVSVQNFIVPPLVRYHWRSATASTDWMAGI